MVRLSALLALLPAAAAEAHSRAWIDPPTRSFRDAAGRHLILHGVNVVYKVAPYLPTNGTFDIDNSLNDEDIADLASWGVNLVRLGVMWEGVEREEGKYDDEYLAKIDALINKLGEKGIYTIVDAHQDVWANSICGEGIPNFYARRVIEKGATCFGGGLAETILSPLLRVAGYCKSMEDYGMSKDKDGNYVVEDCLKATDVFSDFYTSPEALSVARALYNNEDGMQDLFVAFWAHVSKRLAKNPHVLGFDPLNEPFAAWDGIVEAVRRILPGGFDREVLAPLYERIHYANQQGDASSILLFEPSIFPDDNPFGVRHLGFKTPPGGDIGSAHHALNSHTYCCEEKTQADSCAATGEPGNDTEAAATCLKYHQNNIGIRIQDAERLGIPHMVSEFGACLETEVCAREIQQVADVCDEHLSSWAYWEFKKYHDITTSAGSHSEGFYANDGSLQSLKVKAIARTYVRAAQGTVEAMKFNTDDGVFTASLKVDTSIDAPTEVHALQGGKQDVAWYPSGADVFVTGPGGSELSKDQFVLKKGDANKLLVQVVDKSLSGQTIGITVISKATLV